MKKLLKVFGWLLVVIILLLPVAITFTVGWRPFLGPRTRALTSRTFESTPERLARGKYIAENVSGCMFCHTPHDWSALGKVATYSNLGSGEVIPLPDLPGR